jgi:hypothetical protein
VNISGHNDIWFICGEENERYLRLMENSCNRNANSWCRQACTPVKILLKRSWVPESTSTYCSEKMHSGFQDSSKSRIISILIYSLHPVLVMSLLDNDILVMVLLRDVFQMTVYTIEYLWKSVHRRSYRSCSHPTVKRIEAKYIAWSGVRCWSWSEGDRW